MQMAILVIGTMAATATIITMLDKKKRSLELELMQLIAIAEIEEKIRINKFNHKNMAIGRTTPDQDAIIHVAYKVLEQRREEREKLQKWRRYAIHSKKFRVRKKYQNRIRNYYTTKAR